MVDDDEIALRGDIPGSRHDLGAVDSLHMARKPSGKEVTEESLADSSSFATMFDQLGLLVLGAHPLCNRSQDGCELVSCHFVILDQ